ncbi:hypothetical protein TVAGG3_0867000 [Trichomonas vaginalis G3]|uniref:hypothetical protein n=1 Tax=Trichomonas vaginalis (strain ATCC PRA-98 / G3) TaxID=412133 RepID=UPI0021E57AFE|nr:hypothetical protein TVAGG3_0867000 [Trichomonas vaginalis G3]KAI5501102.1 hypothetical protein TVAGG3_0867000 [Trichomonas vaginalis G3]
MYSIDPYRYGLHPERKLSPISYSIRLRCQIDERMAEKISIRKRHEYFLYTHVSLNYDEINKSIVSETLWKAKQFQFRAAVDNDFGYYDVFKEGMKKYLFERKDIFPESELADIEKFVTYAKPENFCIMNPYTKKWSHTVLKFWKN